MTASAKENPEEMMGGSEQGEEPELFVMESLQPMLFSIRVCPSKAALQRIIEDHGGELTSKVGGPHTLRLLPTGEKSFSVTSDVFSAQYVYDCVKEKRLLDPSKYRVNKKSCYTDDVKVLDIIRGVRSWADCVRVEVNFADEVSDFSDDEDFNVLMQNKTWKTGRRPYSRIEQKSILDFIIKHKRYGDVKGNVLWKDIERRKVCPLRSWESMKEHYRKVIITDLGTYQLSKKIETKLYKGYTDGKYHEESSDDSGGSEEEEEEKADSKKEKREEESASRSSGRETPNEKLILPKLRKELREEAGAQKVLRDPEEAHGEEEDEQSELRLQEETDIEDEEEAEDKDQEKAEEKGVKEGVDDGAYAEVERQVASFDAGVANSTQAFEIVLADGEFENPPKRTASYLKELAEDWEESRGSLPDKSQNEEETEATCTENKQEKGRSGGAPNGNLHKNTHDEYKAQDGERIFTKVLSSCSHDGLTHQIVNAEVQSSESTSNPVKTKKNNDMFTEKEAEEIANYLVEMSSSVAWEEQAVAESKRNEGGDALQLDQLPKDGLPKNSEENAKTHNSGGDSGRENNGKGTSCHDDDVELADSSAEDSVFQTCPSTTDSHTYQDAGKDTHLAQKPQNLVEEGEAYRRRSVSEEETVQTVKKNKINGTKGDTSSSASENKKKSKKGQLQDKQLGSSGSSPVSKDVSQEKTRTKKPRKRRPLLDESTSSDSEVLITRSRKVDMGQILSCPAKGQKTRSTCGKEETEDENASPRTPDRQRQKGRKAAGVSSSPGSTSPASLPRVKHQSRKTKDANHNVGVEKVARKMKKGERKAVLEEDNSDSDVNDVDSLATEEEESSSGFSGTPVSDPCYSIDTHTGYYDRSFNPSQGLVRNVSSKRRKINTAKGNGVKMPYTHEEDVEILMYIDDHHSHSQVGGRELWQKMEGQGVLPNRSWHSLKERYRKRIVPNLNIYQRYGLSKTMLQRFKKHSQPADDSPRAKASEIYRQPYSHEEDLCILNFIIKNKRHSEVGGKSLWTLMASCEAGLKGRTWLSLKERYRMSIVRHLHSFNLSDDEILKFKKSGKRSKNLRLTHKHPPNASVYKFAKVRLSSQAKKRSETSSVSESEDTREQEEEETRGGSESRTEGNVSSKGRGKRGGEERASTSNVQEDIDDSGGFKQPKRRGVLARVTEEKERAYSPEIPFLDGSVFERKRKLYTEPEGNKVLTPQVMSKKDGEERLEEGKRMKRRKLNNVSFSEQEIGEGGIEGSRGSKQEMEVSTDMQVEDSVEDHVESDDKLPLLIYRDEEVESDVEITAKITEDQETVKEKVNDSVEITDKDNMDIDSASERTVAPPAEVNSKEASDSVSPENDKENISRTPIAFIPENTQRLSPRKRNSMKFTQKPSSATSQSESSAPDIVDDTEPDKVEKLDKKKRKKERNSLPATTSSPDKRVTRRSLELEKTLPKQKLRIRPLHKNK
ncbi:uncharacterized protein LOC134785238 isoform X2 [Penaeus indicus]|uniref:uncharacterized protein LOC134785238 isoform X2 n=1 Tax=Penaeus indicus TaxID=29960 RepID=UPI00300D600C